MVAERGYAHLMCGEPADKRDFGDRRTAGRIITIVNMRPGYAAGYEEFMAESSASRTDQVKAKAVCADLKSTAQLEEVSEESLCFLVAMPVPQIMEDVTGVIRFASQERIHESIVEETIDVPVSLVTEETIEVEKLDGTCAAQAQSGRSCRGSELKDRWLSVTPTSC